VNADWFLINRPWPPDNAPAFDLFDWCPAWCAGHVDDTMPDTHHTGWFRFGPDGVVVEQIDGQAAWVSVADVDRDAHRTEEQAALLEFQIVMAERFAARQPIRAARRELASAGLAVAA
jgi:hypothetical protein